MDHIKILQALGSLEKDIWLSDIKNNKTKSELALKVSKIWSEVYKITPNEEFEGEEYKEELRKALNGQGIDI